MSENSSTSIAGKVALVTGGARGLGAATARSLSAAGAQVFVLDRHRPDPAELFDEQVTFLVGDVTDLDAMTHAVETIGRETGRLDIVIANAGVVARGATLRASSPATVDRLFDVNVGGALNTVRAALPALIESRGRLVLISSVFAFVNGAGTIPYAMSKAAVEQLGRGLRVELAARGISVTTAYFAMIDTDMIRQSVDEDPAARALLDTQPKLLRKRISPEEAADAVVDGLRRRDPRVIRPRRWSAVSRLRGLLGPSLDSQLTRDGTVQHILERLDAREGEDLLTSEEPSSPRQLDAASNQVANLLVDRGIRSGDKVALSCVEHPAVHDDLLPSMSGLVGACWPHTTRTATPGAPRSPG